MQHVNLSISSFLSKLCRYNIHVCMINMISFVVSAVQYPINICAAPLAAYITHTLALQYSILLHSSISDFLPAPCQLAGSVSTTHTAAVQLLQLQSAGAHPTQTLATGSWSRVNVIVPGPVTLCKLSPRPTYNLAVVKQVPALCLQVSLSCVE